MERARPRKMSPPRLNPVVPKPHVSQGRGHGPPVGEHPMKGVGAERCDESLRSLQAVYRRFHQLPHLFGRGCIEAQPVRLGTSNLIYLEPRNTVNAARGAV